VGKIVGVFFGVTQTDHEIDCDFDRFLESKSLQIGFKFHQTSIQTSMLFSIPFSDRFLIDFGASKPWKCWLFIVGVLIFMKSLFRESYPNIIQFLAKHPPTILQTSITNHIKNYINKYIDILLIFDRKCLPKSSPSRSGACYFCSPMASERPQRPFFRKSKPLDLNFIKKVIPNLRNSSLQTSISSKNDPEIQK